MKNLLTIVSVMLMTFVFFSCEKETLVEPVKEPSTTTPIPTQLSINDVKSEDGILILGNI